MAKSSMQRLTDLGEHLIPAKQADLEAVKRAAKTKEEVDAFTRQLVESRGQGWAPNVYGLADHETRRPEGGFLRMLYPGAVPNDPSSVGVAITAESFSLQTVIEDAIAALFPKELEALIVMHLERQVEGRLRLSAEERAKRLETLTRELRALEIEEETLISKLAAEGQRVLRRADADPEVVLGLADAA